jgi:DNA modification methylase
MTETLQQNNIAEKFNVKIDGDWAFAGNISTNQFTHGYHRYPAKFIPQMVKKIIEDFTCETDKIADVFAGCGTTLVESKIHGRNSIGVDINPVAKLITMAKITPIEPQKLERAIIKLYKRIKYFKPEKSYAKKKHDRIDYWFRPEEKNKIGFLYSLISQIDDEELKIFFLCALSNIFKNCSRWLQSSTKPQIDPDKTPSEPFYSFNFQLKRMVKKNAEFYKELKDSGNLKKKCEIKLADAKKTRIRANTIGAIITSPPYVTSYEYADIHQLTGYWFDYISDLRLFRKNFIGTFYSNSNSTSTKTPITKSIVSELNKKDKKVAREVAKYFNDMFAVSKEMHRILKDDGVVCMVVGNTTMKDVRIKSAEAFAEMLTMNGFKIDKVIKREISFKLIPAIRDKKTGKFTTLSNLDSQLVYPEEFIIIARK